VWRIAANHLARIRRGRREMISLELLDERLRTGLRPEAADASARPDPEEEALARELRLRCTQAMLLSLDRELRLAYILGDVFELSGDEAAEVLDVDAATYRKRLSRARFRLHAFMRSWCGVFDDANPCRCGGQVACAKERGLLDPADLDLSRHPARKIERAAAEVTGLLRVAEVIGAHPEYIAPASLVKSLRALVDAT
jgi:hypothetical protein